ncbi:MAG: serine/threonine protein kinase [Parasporobacterium sp.]|nr:serine/threonine protein kinase [Parasporobacterium sp.]
MRVNDSPSAYEELYHVKSGEKTSISIVKNIVSQQVYCRKSLSVYNIRVYEYLKDNPHPNIPEVCDYEEQDGVLTVYEEYIRGEALDYVLDNRRMDKLEKIHILEEVCDALTFLHSAKPYPIIHRDVKPSNIMITEDGRVVLTDYDAAKVFTPGQIRDTTLMGTEGSAAPEQYGFAQSDVRTDIYALGALIKQMFPKDFRMKRIADRAMEIAPRDRYGSVSEVKELLKRPHHRAAEKQPEDGFYTEYFCTNCDAILNDQPGFGYNDGTWKCTVCGQQLFGEEAGDTGGRFNGIIWYCDGCGTILNKQEGFDYYGDEWTCTECGFANDITEDNIIQEKPRK